MRVRPAVILLNREQTHILLMHYQYGGTDVFGIPGGNPEARETLAQTLVRELREELNVTVQVGQLVAVGEILERDGQDYALHCVFTGTIIEGEPQINPQQTSATGLVWKRLDALEHCVVYPDIAALLSTFPASLPRDNIYLGQIPKTWLG